MPKKTEKGCVGFFHRGIMASGRIIAAFTEDSTPDSLYSEKLKYYGSGLEFKYVSCEDPEDVFKKFRKGLELTDGDMGFGHIEATTKILKEASGVNIAHGWPKKVKETSEKDDKKKSEEKPKPKSTKKKDDSDDEDDKKTTKSKTPTKKKSNDSDDEKDKKSTSKAKTAAAASKNDEKPKPKTSRKVESSSSDSDSDSDTDSDDGKKSSSKRKASPTKKK